MMGYDRACDACAHTKLHTKERMLLFEMITYYPIPISSCLTPYILVCHTSIGLECGVLVLWGLGLQPLPLLWVQLAAHVQYGGIACCPLQEAIQGGGVYTRPLPLIGGDRAWLFTFGKVYFKPLGRSTLMLGTGVDPLGAILTLLRTGMGTAGIVPIG